MAAPRAGSGSAGRGRGDPSLGVSGGSRRSVIPPPLPPCADTASDNARTPRPRGPGLWPCTAPAMAEGGAGGNQPPREHPRNLQGLLQMAITAGNEPSQLEPMSDERRQWLQEAMAQAFRGQLEEVEQMKECLRVLEAMSPGGDGGESSEPAEGDPSRQASALELLAELCENLDNAADFCKLDGMRLLAHRYLEHPVPDLRWRAAHLVGTCAQNVPKVQEQALALGCMRKLLRLLDHDGADLVRVKALFAISCLVRAQEGGLQQFLRLDGFSVLMRAMQSPVQKLKVKSAFLLQNLLLDNPEHKETLCSMGMVQQLVALIRSEHSPFHEHVLGALCSLVTDFPQGVRECREPQLALEELLKERCQLLQQQEEFQEELEFCERLQRVCFQTPPEDSSMDR
ncbi:hsp70-binding protein 1 isoform X2 [Pelodiscus sinensis]|uniref:hsp70-binding protein 1 isoform X2 n=1 Tax=Pelodiscus sinensis TaxID=13735 RepID=UPI003F6B5BD2